MAQKTINPTLFGGMSGEFADASPRTTMKVWCNSQRSDNTLLFGDMLAYRSEAGAATLVTDYADYEGDVKLCFLVNPKENVLKSGIVNRGNETATPFAEVGEGHYSVATMGHIWIPAKIIYASDEPFDDTGCDYVFWHRQSLWFANEPNQGFTPYNKITGVRLRRAILLSKSEIDDKFSEATVLAEVEVCNPYLTNIENA